MLTRNLPERLKAVGVDPELRQARPKRRRFVVFRPFGRVVDHARRRIVRVAPAALRAVLDPALGRRRCGPWAAT